MLSFRNVLGTTPSFKTMGFSIRMKWRRCSNSSFTCCGRLWETRQNNCREAEEVGRNSIKYSHWKMWQERKFCMRNQNNYSSYTRRSCKHKKHETIGQCMEIDHRYSRYFQTLMRRIRAYNPITKLNLPSGLWSEDIDEIGGGLHQHFSKYFGPRVKWKHGILLKNQTPSAYQG